MTSNAASRHPGESRDRIPGVIPAKAGIQFFKASWMPDQVRHDIERGKSSPRRKPDRIPGVIPAKAGIQFFHNVLDTGFRRCDSKRTENRFTNISGGGIV
jgi:hypothetical protein